MRDFGQDPSCTSLKHVKFNAVAAAAPSCCSPTRRRRCSSSKLLQADSTPSLQQIYAAAVRLNVVAAADLRCCSRRLCSSSKLLQSDSSPTTHRRRCSSAKLLQADSAQSLQQLYVAAFRLNVVAAADLRCCSLTQRHINVAARHIAVAEAHLRCRQGATRSHHRSGIGRVYSLQRYI